jgi:hypothetical protein
VSERTDDRLWIAKDWWNVLGHGYGGTFEATGANGFSHQATTGMLSYWMLKRWFRRQEKEARKLYRKHRGFA